MNFSKKTVFLADDNHAYLMDSYMVLSKMGFNVVTIEGGLELLEALRNNKPDLLLMDTKMTKLDGIEALQLIKADTELASVPVVMISAESSEETRKKCMESGCDDYLVKPVSIAQLHDVIQNSIYAPLGYVRKNLRILFQSKVMLSCGHITIFLRSETLSEKGIFIRMNEPYEVGTDVAVGLKLDNEKYLNLDGKVIYRNVPSSDEPSMSGGIAVKFAETDSRKLFMLSNYVKGLLEIPFHDPKLG